MPYAFDALDKYIKKYPKIDIISSALSFYFWRGCENIYGNKVINYSSKCHEEIRSTKKDLFSVLMGLRSCFDMPQIYTSCIIKRTLFEEIKFNSGGQFYFSINYLIYFRLPCPGLYNQELLEGVHCVLRVRPKYLHPRRRVVVQNRVLTRC